MSQDITSPLTAETTICGLFKEEFHYEIPPYQRAYSWTAKNLERFIKDLEDQPNAKDYYLGHFLLELSNRSRNEGLYCFQVIDGQQRLTTVIIFFSCAFRELERRNKSAASQDPLRPSHATLLRQRYLANSAGSRLKTVGYDDPFFNRLIISGMDESIDSAAPRSQKLIRAARDYFTKRLEEEFCTTEQLLSWCDMIETATVSTFTLQGEKAKARATQIFAFQNDRGITPTKLELLKAFLMHGVYLHSTTGAEVKTIEEIQSDFAEIHRIHEGISLLDEDQVLAHHCTAFLYSWEPSLQSIEFALASAEGKEKIQWIRDFSGELRQTFRLVKEIEDASAADFALADVLFLDAYNSWPLLIKLHRLHSSEKQSPLFRRALRLMEITLFKIDFSRADFRTNGFHACAKSYAGRMKELVDMLTHWSQNGFKDHWRFNQVFTDALNRPHQYFKATRYLLWKHENKLAIEHKNPPTLPSQFLNLIGDRRWDETIEHIMPQNPERIEVDQEFRDQYLHRLGNLVLMNRGKNSSASNDLPANKVGHFLKSGLISHKIVLEQINNSAAATGWWISEIQTREKEIIRFAIEYWEASSPPLENE